MLGEHYRQHGTPSRASRRCALHPCTVSAKAMVCDAAFVCWQAANQAGKKPLPWNIPAAFNLSLEKHAVQVLLDRCAVTGVSSAPHVHQALITTAQHWSPCGVYSQFPESYVDRGVLCVCCDCRVAHVINVLVTSHAAQLAGAATAYLLSYLVAAVDADAALRLCPQLQLVRLRCFSTRPGVKLRLHATLEDEQPAQQDYAGTISARCAGSSHVLRCGSCLSGCAVHGCGFCWPDVVLQLGAAEWLLDA